MYALQHPRTRTVHTNCIYVNFVLSTFILTLPYTHPLLSPCFSFLLSISHSSSPRGNNIPYVPSLCVKLCCYSNTHHHNFNIGDSRRGVSMALAFSSIPLAPPELEDATTRPSRPQLNFAWPRATRSATTSLGPEQLARPRIYLAPSNSLGHATSSPGHEHATQPPLRDRSASATSPVSSSINNSYSLLFHCL